MVHVSSALTMRAAGRCITTQSNERHPHTLMGCMFEYDLSHEETVSFSEEEMAMIHSDRNRKAKQANGNSLLTRSLQFKKVFTTYSSMHLKIICIYSHVLQSDSF